MNKCYTCAYEYAKAKHGNQMYVKHPYMYHCIGVFKIINSLNGKNHIDIDFITQVSLLHDVLEDTDTTYEELCEKFSKKVADGVLALTKNKSFGHDEALIDSIKRIKNQPTEIKMVKMADRIFNISTINEKWSIAQSRHYLEASVIIYNELKEYNSELANMLQNSIKKYEKELDYLQEKQKN